VSIARASDYDLPRLATAVGESLRLIGGLEAIVRPGDRVFVKINHLPPPSPPERGIITHPVFAEAVLRLLKSAGAEITVGDEIEPGATDGFSVSGFRQMCQRVGVRLINLREEGFVATECKGYFLETVYRSRTAIEADVIVNLPKLKTHALTVFTGGVKNMYGTIPVNLRRRLHGDYPRSEDFSRMLTDIFSGVRPHLTVMDGIVAMEGEGPSGGGLRDLGVVLASRDAVALDAVATKIIGMDPMDIGTTRYAHERGLGVGRLDSIDVAGHSIESVAVRDFRLPASAARTILSRIPAPLSRFAVGQFSVRPRVVKQRCTACAECVRACPTGAITIKDKTAGIDRGTCIECMCCHEVCRFDAIVTELPAVGNAVSTIADTVRKLAGR